MEVIDGRVDITVFDDIMLDSVNLEVCQPRPLVT